MEKFMKVCSLHKILTIYCSSNPLIFAMNALQVCEECTDECCDGTCLVFQYDSYQVNLIFRNIWKTFYVTYQISKKCFSVNIFNFYGFYSQRFELEKEKPTIVKINTLEKKKHKKRRMIKSKKISKI